MRNESESHGNTSKTLGGWGQGSPITNSDLLLLRKAIRENWPVSPEVRQTILERIMEEFNTDGLGGRRYVALARVVLAMVQSNIDQTEGEVAKWRVS